MWLNIKQSVYEASDHVIWQKFNAFIYTNDVSKGANA